MPFSGGGSNGAIAVEGHTLQPGDAVRAHYLVSTSSEYWPMLDIPLKGGRLLEDADNHRDQRVCVVDEAFARRYWPDTDPIGRRLTIGPQFVEDEARTIVGVVGEIKQNQLSDAPGFGTIYLPYRGAGNIFFSLMVRTSLSPESFGPTLQKTILQLDPELPIDNLRTLEARIDETVLMRRSLAILAGIFASVALALAALGTYGVLAYAVSQRRREIGVRMAIGALPGQILAQFFRLGAVLLGIGLVFGIGLAALAGWLIRRQLYEVGGFHVGVLATTAGVMLVVVLLATLLPSRRAARVNPLDALRDE